MKISPKILVGAILASCLFFASNTFAAGSDRTEWGGRDISYESSGTTNFSRSVSGATWYYYSLQGYSSDSDLDKSVAVPFNSDNTEKVLVPVNVCKPYGGFWVLLRNGYTRDENGNATLASRPASAIQLRDIYDSNAGFYGDRNMIIYKNPSDFPSSHPEGEKIDGIEAIAYGTMSAVKGLFTSLIGTTAIPSNVSGWDNDSSLSYFCSGQNSANIPTETASFTSFSTVSSSDNFTSAPVRDGNGYLSESLIVPAGKQITLTFRHYIAKSIAEPLEASELSYSLNGDGNNKTGTLSTTDLTSRTNINGIDYYHNAGSVIEDTITFTADQKVTYCQAATFNGGSPKVYNPATFKVTSGGASISSSACVTIEPVTASPDAVSDCNQDGGYGSKMSATSTNIGGTVATVGVSKNGSLFVTSAKDDNDSVLVYAKPGDTFQFSFAICFWAHKAGGGLTSNSSRTNVSNVHWNIFDVSVGGGDGNTTEETDKYLFGRLNELLGQRIYVSGYDVKTNKLTVDSFVKGGTIDSPINSSEDAYFTINVPRLQISFASPDNLPRGEGEGTGYETVSSDLGIIGATLSQTLTYADLSLWTQCLSNKSGDKKCGFDIKADPYGWGRVNKMADHEGFVLAHQAYEEGYTRASGEWMFSEDDLEKTASIATPYNFDTDVQSEIIGYEDGTVHPGDEISVSANIDILPRVNPLTSNKNENGEFVPYATSTHANTKVELIELILRDTANLDNTYTYDDGEVVHQANLRDILNNNVDRFNKRTICNMFRGYLGTDLGECVSKVVKGNDNALKTTPDLMVIGNKDSNPAGEMGYFNTNKPLEKITRVVPDIEAGYKYCVAVGINHGDSHNLPGETLTEENGANPYSVSSSLNPSAKISWKVSKMSCRTITKRPSFQVWNGGVYSGGDIKTSPSDKRTNTKTTSNLVDENDPLMDKDKKRQATGRAYFGSWAEYFVVAKGDVENFASASAFGYTDPFHWDKLDKNGNVVEGFTVHSAVTGLNAKYYSNCEIARLTIANSTCDEGKSGGYAAKNGDTDNVALESYKQRILNYYANANATSGDPGVISGGDQQTLQASIDNGTFTYGKQNGADYLKVLGNYNINYPIIRDFGKGTLVIEVDGHLTIDQNICLGGGLCEQASNSLENWKSGYDQNVNNLSLFSDNATEPISGGDLSGLPQVIIIAESISIGSEVSQIDAWLITSSNKEGYDGGYINTCKEFKNSETGANECWKTLKINGPVVTSALLLNRTGGAWPGFSSDVGNEAYDVLYKEMWDYINNRIEQALSNPADPYYVQAEAACVSKKYSIQTCIKSRVKTQVKEDFLKYRVNGDGSERSEEERKAYVYSGNFSANSATISANKIYTRDLTCDGSLTPAEIFDLHPIAYYWAIAESQKGNQAIVTYAQEFAPRY